MKTKRALTITLIIGLLIAVLLPATGVMAEAQYPLNRGMIRSISASNGLSEYNGTKVTELNKSRAGDVAAIEWAEKLFAKPADYVLENEVEDYDGAPVTLNGLPLKDVWVFKIDYFRNGNTNDVILDTKGYRNVIGRYNFVPYTLNLNKNLIQELGIDMDNLAVFFLDYRWNNETNDWAEPDSGQWFRRLYSEDATEYSVNKEDCTLTFSEQWPEWYALAYFSDEEYPTPTPEPTATPTPTTSAAPTTSADPSATAAPTLAPTASATPAAPADPSATAAPQDTASPVETATPAPTDNAATGDVNTLPFILVAVASAAGAALMIARRRANQL